MNARTNGGKRGADHGTPEVGTLVPQPHGGALRYGGTNKGGVGRPRDAIRATMRQHLDETLIDAVLQDWKAGVLTSLQVAELFGKYGLGTQTEAVTPDDLKDAATRIVGEVVTILLDEEHWPLEKVQAVAARITRAAEGNHSREGR